MNRSPLALFALAFAASLACGQAARGPDAAERVALLKTNRALLDDLLNEGVRFGEANSALERAAHSQNVSARLARELRAAVEGNDADRIAEIGEYFAKMVDDGFRPNLESAHEQIKSGDENYDRLQKLHGDAAAGLHDLEALIPAQGKIANDPRVKDARAKVAAAAAAVGQPKKD